jgi:iron(III) transport system permease protein
MQVEALGHADPAKASLFARLRRGPAALTLGLGLVLAVLVLPPLYFLVQGSLVVQGADGSSEFSLRAFSDLFARRGIAQSAVNSVIFSLASAVVSLIVGGISAWLVERTTTRLKSFVYLTTIISFGTPHVLYVSAWMLLLGRSGPVNTWWRQLTGSTESLVNVYGLFSMALIEGLLWSPLVFLMLSATLRNFNPDFEEAARMSGANTWQALKRITFRLSAPAVFALAMLVFIRTMEAFEVPAIVGLPGSIYVLTTDIYNTMHLTMPPDISLASSMSVVLLLIVGLLLHFYGRMTQNAERFATVTGKSFRPKQIDLGPWRYVADAVLFFFFLILLALPLGILAWASLLPYFQTPSAAALARVSFANYARVFASDRYLSLAFNTIIIAVVSASVVMLVTALVAWVSARKASGSRVLDQLATLPLVFPGIVLGVGVMQLFLNISIGVYGTIWIITWAFVINYLPYGMRYSSAGMLQLHKELEEAAYMSGASRMIGFRRIVLPLLTPSVIAGWLFVFLIAARSLTLPVLLSGPSSQTVAVAMFDLWSGGQSTELAALGLVWTGFMTIIAFIFYLVGRRGGGGLYAG